ncbi:MAG: rhodanese-like domain-containing protein [Alphaproteobacteria bacterium]
MEVEDLARRLRAPDPPLVLDVREPWETRICALPGSLMVPMGQLGAELGALPRDRPLVVLCHHGVRSWHVTSWLRRNGFANVINLRGGIDAWARRVDPGMSIY